MSLSSSKLLRWSAAVAALALPVAAFAETPDTSNVTLIVQNIQNVLNIVITIVFILAIVVFGWGVVKYVTAANNPEKEKEARSFLWWGVIGIFVLAAVFGLVQFVAKYFGVGRNQGTINIPKVQPASQ